MKIVAAAVAVVHGFDGCRFLRSSRALGFGWSAGRAAQKLMLPLAISAGGKKVASVLVAVLGTELRQKLTLLLVCSVTSWLTAAEIEVVAVVGPVQS